MQLLGGEGGKKSYDERVTMLEDLAKSNRVGKRSYRALKEPA